MDMSGDDSSPTDEGEALAGFVVISELTSCPSSEEEEANPTDSPLEGQLGEYIGLYMQQYGRSDEWKYMYKLLCYSFLRFITHKVVRQ